MGTAFEEMIGGPFGRVVQFVPLVERKVRLILDVRCETAVVLALDGEGHVTLANPRGA